MNYILQLECSTCGYSHAEWKGETACNDLFHTIGHISVSEQSQDELEPLPEKNIHIVWCGTVDSNDVLGVLDGSYSVKWDGEDIGEVLKHGRE